MSEAAHGRRGLRRTVAMGAVVLVAGLVPGTGVGTGAAADEGGQTVDRALAYRCVLPGGGGGERAATVRISAVLPRQVRAGRPVHPESVIVGVQLSPEAVADLVAVGAAKTGGIVRLTTLVTQDAPDAETVEAPWAQLSAPETAVPAQGAYTIEARGAVPTVTARSEGELAFSAGAVSLDLLARGADDRPTTPPNLSLACTPEPGEKTEFARVAVTAATAPATPPGPGPGERPRPPVVEEPGGPAQQPGRGEEPGGGKADGEASGKGDGRECVEEPPFPLEPTPAHGYIAGYSNVRKLGGAIFLKEPGMLRVNMLKAYQLLICNPPEGPYFAIYSDVRFDHRGKPQLPPATSTFLTFGFMPTTATVELTAVGPMEIVTHGYPLDEQGRQPEVSTVTGKVWIRLYDVKVNGTPLDVGPRCRSARPMDLVLTGRGYNDVDGRPHGYTVAGGGPLTATATLPDFRGCRAGAGAGTGAGAGEGSGVRAAVRAGEDLDRLFTASLSGTGNYMKMTQGPLCAPGSPHCPDPPRPRPER
ncbi:DUF6801 domain-containing protein [Streptomyces sp. NPDC045431]|uniref:DUF6801 domain-containing protein n=1 Tax=Streptomyces sp. NPDC045431 TaxID=3155613 RepID=UPI0033CB9CFC